MTNSTFTITDLTRLLLITLGQLKRMTAVARTAVVQRQQAEAERDILKGPAQLAANLLFKLDQRGGLGSDTHHVIKETQLALDAALHDKARTA